MMRYARFFIGFILVIMLQTLGFATNGLADNSNSTRFSGALGAIDPLNSPQWSAMHARFLENGPVVFDQKVQVFAPESAEDSLNIPVSFKVEGLGQVEEIVVFADLNPLPLVLKFRPGELAPHLAFRFKLQQGSPLRVAARSVEGIWHVGTVFINAAGGGCTAPSLGMATGNWADTLGQVSANVWQRPDNNRLRLRIMHPMDTGLADGIPRFHLETLVIRDQADLQTLAELELFEPVSENPLLSFDVGQHQGFVLSARDNNGNRVNTKIADGLVQ